MSAGGAVVALVFLLIFGAYLAGLVFWIMKIVEVARIPDHQFRLAGSDKTAWILVVVLAQIIGALIWQFAKRNEVLAARYQVPPPPPGWYPDLGGEGLRWWDGLQWTPYRQAPPPADPSAAPVQEPQ